MKNLLCFATTILLLISCSNDNNITSPINENNLKYIVNLKVEIPIEEIQAPSLKAKSEILEGDPLFYNITIYKETGEVYYAYYNSVEYDSGTESGYRGNYNTFTSDGNTYSTILNLAPGNYHIAMLIHRKDAKHPNSSIHSVDPIGNYNNDSYNSAIAGLTKYHNGGVYFNTADFTVVALEKDQNLSMQLKPMWSYIDININDAQTFAVPDGTNALQFIVSPRYYGFYVKTQLAPFKNEKPIIVPLDSIRSASIFNLRNTVSKSILTDNTISASIKYLKIDSDTTILGSKDLYIPNASLENGFYYNVYGNLGNPNEKSMTISLGSFAKEDVNINF